MYPHIQHPSPHLPPSSHHNYGTRIRRNSILRPSARLRQTPPSPHPPPRKIKPVPTPPPHHPVLLTSEPSFPVFPLPGVMLHPEDASNKVFHAIGRSFLSVENRAMTIKDLAEMTLKYGLMCQNVSAASQAITTYIRTHMARCETQQDHPLLLRHVLSGTLADDDLVPALCSRMGGATHSIKSGLKDSTTSGKNVAQVTQGAPEGERLTNFRRGTMVWYLSKATGVSCPFARAGICLSKYGKEGTKVMRKHTDELHAVPKKHSHHDAARCGEKRKRLRRGCRQDSDGSQASSSAGGDSQSAAVDGGYGELCIDPSDDERPPKVKLTLRLRPSLPCVPTLAAVSLPREVIDLSNEVSSSSSEDDARANDTDDVNMRPDQSEAPWSLPPYPRRSISVPCYTPTCDERTHLLSFSEQRRAAEDEKRRSPSASWSASPPPDSDHDDFDPDSDVDWDSASLSVPSPAPDLQVKVETSDDLQLFKHEPTDIRGMLDAWEDLDCAPTSMFSSTAIKLPATDDLGFDALELWNWEFDHGWTGTPESQQDLPAVKVEPDDIPTSFRALAPESPTPPHSPFTSSSHNSSPSPTSELGVVPFTFQSHLSSFSPPTSHSPSSFLTETNGGACALTWQDAELLGPDSVHPHEFEDEWASGVKTHANCNLLPRLALNAVPSETEENRIDVACAVFKETEACHAASRIHSSHPIVAVPNIVVVRTCRPCTPDVYATQIEGISVYQTTLGRALLLRRIDTDFVNLSTILSHLSLPPPSPLPTGCVDVSHPSLSIDGTWAPLNVARLYAHGLPEGLENIFLSDDLVMRFPTALQDFYQQSVSGRLLNQFGPHFNASLSLSGIGNPVLTSQPDDGKFVKEDVWEAIAEARHAEDPLFAIPPSVNDALAALHPPTSAAEATALPETPLSPTEQEIFRVLCVHPDWETEEAEASEGKAVTIPDHGLARDKPLRRSRRVADAVAARSRVAPPRTKGSRHS